VTSQTDYWRDTFFDGLGSTLLGAALAVVGIWLTLRHDRAIARESHLLDLGQRLVDRSVEVTGELSDSLTGSLDRRTEIEYMNLWLRFIRATESTDPHLATCLKAARSNLGNTTPAPKWVGDDPWDWFLTSAGQVQTLVQARLDDPSAFRRMRKAERAELLRDINDGSYVRP